MKLPPFGVALKTSLAYASIATFWKVASDRILAHLFAHDSFALLESYKGFGFITVTSALLYIGLRRAEDRGRRFGRDADSQGPAVPAFFLATIVSIVIVGLAVANYRATRRALEQNAFAQTRALADVKARELGRWLDAQRANARLFAESEKTLSIAQRIALRGADREAILADLERGAKAYGFASAQLLDARGRHALAPGAPVAPAVAAAARRSLATGAPALVDPHASASDGALRFGYVTPLVEADGATRGDLFIYAQIDASNSLDPFIRSWPASNARGAGALAVRDGDGFLLRIGDPDPGVALKTWRENLATSTVPAAVFLRGEADSTRAADPQGVTVIAAGREVPGANWMLVARIAEADALAGLESAGRMAALIAALAVAATWLVAAIAWNSQQQARDRADRHFRLAFEQASVGMAHVGLDGKFLRVNGRLTDMLGYGADALLDMNILDLSDAEQQAAIAGRMEEFRSGAITECRREYRFRRDDGATMEAAVFAALGRGEAAEPDYLMLVVEDITRRKQAEDALRLSEERFAFAMRATEAGLWDWRPQQGGTYHSPRWLAIVGYGPDELADDSRLWSEITEPGATALLLGKIEEMRARNETVFAFETRLRHKNGGWIDILSRGFPLFDPQGNLVRVVGSITDITERKRDEARLRLAATVFASTHEGVVVTDAARKILAVNPAFESITGYSEDEARGKNMSLVRSGRHGRDFYQAMWRSIDSEGFWRGEIWNRRKDGEVFPELLSISAVTDEAGAITNYVGLFTDIGRLKQSETRLEFLAHHDPLTRLPNALLLRLRIEHAVERARRSGAPGAVLFLDLDRFKTINDSLGHAAGDQLLIEAAGRWSNRLRASDTLARLGGDEFAVLIEEAEDPHAIAALAKTLIEAMAQPFALAGGREAFVGVSVGVSLFPANGEDAESLIQHAGSALDLAKQTGGSAVRFYSDAMTRSANSRLELEAGLRRALERNEFALQFQPLVSLADREIFGVEALVRWRSPHGLIPPDQFIPLAEETGLIMPLGDWVLREACARAVAWRAMGAEIDVIAVNLSPVQLAQADICARIAQTLRETGLPPECLEIEITESALLEQGVEAEGKLAELKALGLRIAIDDFGAGHSSLFYLKRFPIDQLKLDRSFIVDIPADPTSMEIAAAIVRLAHSLKVKALAEGVETEAQAEFLRACGCQLAQGYLFSRPLWEADLIKLLGAEGSAAAIA